MKKLCAGIGAALALCACAAPEMHTSAPTAIASASASASAPRVAAAPSPPHTLAFETRKVELLPGDELAVDEVSSDRDDFVAGGTYRVCGRYTLRSRSKARIALVATGGAAVVAPDDIVVTEGSGTFEFRCQLARAGYLRVSLAPIDGGEGFGRVTFGRGTPAHRMHAREGAPAPSSARVPEPQRFEDE
jgi:hypothetical protein